MLFCYFVQNEVYYDVSLISNSRYLIKVTCTSCTRRTSFLLASRRNTLQDSIELDAFRMKVFGFYFEATSIFFGFCGS